MAGIQSRVKEQLCKRRTLIELALLIVLSVGITTRDIDKGEFWFQGDEPRHAMNGVFVLDFVRDLPLGRPVEYAFEYYARYPAVHLLRYDPFFAVAEALFFWGLGVSIATARLTVVFFLLVGVVFWYKLVEQAYNRKIAFFATVLFVTNSSVVLWTKSVMLEVPSLAMGIVAIYLWERYLRTEEKSCLYLCAIASALAVLTKKNLVLLVPLYLLHVLVTNQWRKVLNKQSLLAAGLGLLLAAPYYLIVLALSGPFVATIATSVGPSGTFAPGAHLLMTGNYLYYIRALAYQVEWVILGPTLLFVAMVVVRGESKRHALFLIWIIATYLSLTLVANKQVRYTTFLIPPFILFAVLAVERLRFKVGAVYVSSIVLVIGSSVAVVRAWSVEKPFVSGLAEAAKYVCENPKGSSVLIDSELDGNFVFFVRQCVGSRRLMVLRGSKMLYYSQTTSEGNRLVENIHSGAEIYDLLGKYGTKYLVTQDKPINWEGRKYFRGRNPAIASILRKTLQAGDFTLREEIPFRTSGGFSHISKILIYEYDRDVELTEDTLTIPLPEIGQNVRVRLR